MWILDSAYRDGGIDLWTKDGGNVTKVHYEYDPPFFVHFHDPDYRHEMITALEEQYGAHECTIRTVFGELPGYAVYGGREIAEAIEKQAQHDVDLFNVDVRRDQRFFAEKGLVPCLPEGVDRFSPEISHDLSVMEIRIKGEPETVSAPGEIEIIGKYNERLAGDTEEVLTGLFAAVGSCDPDVVLMPDADTWMPRIRALA